ncbi:MAG: hypothetical protein C4551_03215 [Bacillota bacterium]|nr:MAG: hypothetical protein C4551_03215 [Bacillota bacterium]
MATLTVQQTSLTGLNPAFGAAAAGGDEFVNSGKAVLYVKNGSAGAVTVTVNSQTACNYGFDHDAEVSVPASGERVIGPFPKSRFDDAAGKVQVTYSGVTSVTVAVLEVA